MPKAKFYAVQRGREPGVYTTWAECQKQTSGFGGAVFKSFPTEAQARAFVGAGALVNVFKKEPTSSAARNLTSSNLSSATRNLTSSHPSSVPNSSTGSSEQNFYAIRVGKVPGIYTSWPEARVQLAGIEKPLVKCFKSRERAELWMKGMLETPEPSKTSDTTITTTSTKTEAKRTLGSAPIPTTSLAGTKRKLEPAKPAAMSIAKHRKMGTLATSGGDLELGALLAAEKTQYANLKPGLDSVLPERESIIVYTDGSALGNGRTGARAGVGVYFGPNDSRNISEPLMGPVQTNNRAELTAIIRALQSIDEKQDIKVCSDSDYSIKCIEVWSPNWIKKNWVTSSGKKVENRDLIETILDLVEVRRRSGSRTKFEWVKAHTNTKSGNDYADELATAGSRMHVE